MKSRAQTRRRGDTPGLLVPFHLLAALLLVFMAAHFACSIRSGVYVFWRTAPLALGPAPAPAPFGSRVDVMLESGPSAKRASALIRPDH